MTLMLMCNYIMRDPSLRAELIIRRELRTLMHLKRTERKDEKQQNFRVLGSTSTMLIKPENLDPCSESSLPITDENIATGPSNTNIIYRRKLLYI